MIGVIRLCPKCGGDIPADAPEGGCPGCLLESGLRLLDEEAVAAGDHRGQVDASPRVATRSERLLELLGELGDYELLEEVGRGGQGVVFRARQKSLNRTVALKVISLGQWASEAHLKRFRREAESAASLDHPGIVPIYEVGERDGSCYFSMKFVEGGQLDEVVRDAPMSIRQSAKLIEKVARTVHYAHENGILHRDIKPGNILLDKNGDPHLTDFGLARLLDAQSSVTGTIDVLGTPSYMAPEQAAGETTKLSKATDVYGLGAVLYQLLTGQPPFAGGTTYETIRLLRDTEPRQPRSLNPKIDRDLSTICLKCLEKDPKRRYASALALAEDLEHWLKHEPIQAKQSGVFTHARKWVRRNPSTTVLATSLVIFAIGFALVVWNRTPPVLIPKGVAVLPFENLSDDPDNAYFADGIQEEILTRLAKIEGIKVIARTSTQSYQSKPGKLAEVAKQLGVANIVEGSVQKTADQVRVNVQLINAQTDSHLWAETYDRKLTDILGVESEIAKAIAESLRAKLSGREEQALAVKPTNNPEAYDAYLRGLSFEARSYSASSDFDIDDKAISSYERAVQVDPNFATAWARLSRVNARIYFSGFVPHAGSAPRDAAAKRALEKAQKLDPNSAETLLALGYYQYWVLRHYGAAKATFQQVSKILRGSSDVPHALALIARITGNWDQSIAHYEQALELDPRNTHLLEDAALTYWMVRQFPAALKLYDRALDIMPNDPDMISLKASIHLAQGNLEEVDKLLSEVNEQTPNDNMFGDKIAQLALERNYREALRLMKARPAHFPFHSDFEKGTYYVRLTLMQRLAGDLAGAKITAKQARDAFEPLYKDQPNNAFIARQLAEVYAVMGEKDLAITAAKRAVMLMPRAKNAWFAPQYEETLATVLAMVGENSRAISILGPLLQIPYLAPITPALLRLDPAWDPLRGDPAFQKLCEEKIDKSIAVLPFDNLSGDSNNAYFAEGIQEEILTRLGKIADLKVISRTSTQRYQSKPRDLSEIAKQLGVANILEGSVQRAADQVRVNVQLINAQTDSHLWADTYDRKLTDIFGVESEIAKRIAESLQAKLTGREEQALAVKPTKNPEAYDAYLRGLAFERRDGYVNDILIKAIGFYEKAVELDPDFATAWARLSRADARLFAARVDTTTAARGDAAKYALENAQRLQPNSPETLLALGYYQFSVQRDYPQAKITFGRVSKISPSNSEAPNALGLITQREGDWDQSIGYLEQALTLDPRNIELLKDAAGTYTTLRQFPAALNLYDRALDIAPNSPDLTAEKASIYQARGNLQQAAKLLVGINEQSSITAFVIKLTQLRLERNYGEAVRLLQARLSQFHFSGIEKFSEIEKAFYRLHLACIQRLAGDTANAKLTAEQARTTYEQLHTDQPEKRANWALALSHVYAVMGEKDSALKLAKSAIELLPRTKDPMLGPGCELNLALIETIFGDNSRAISILTELLQTPYVYFFQQQPITPALLRLDPIWDPLRSDPAFQKLCEQTQP
jgi:TolB-like protein/Tfp pilus assembly protein PilF/predicted Ser/Thr protein kinase